MLMQPPAGGDSFTGNDGFTYTAATGVSIEVGAGAIEQAFIRNWTEQTYAGPTVIVVPLTGFSIAVGNGTSQLILTPAGTLAAGTITMPPNPTDNQSLRVTSSQTVTALTVSANAGQSIVGAPTTIGATTPFDYFYSAVNNTWYRR